MSINGSGPARRFSASEAAFTGFRLLAREPATWAVWAGVFVVISLVFGAGIVATIGPTLAEMMQSAGQPSVDPTASLRVLSRILPFEGVLIVVSLGLYAVMFAAVNRAILRPGAGGPGHFALGGDELRQLLVLVILSVVLLAVYIVALIAGFIVGLGVAFAAGAAGGSASSAGPPCW